MKEDKILKHLPIASRQVKRKMDEVFQKFNLTSTQSFTLKFIEENSKIKKVYAKDIENEFDMRRATVAGIIQLMEQNELIERSSESTDARMKEITLTRKALDKEYSIDLEMKKLEKQITKNISKEELTNFFDTLNKISMNLLE